jgi:hypothetical protein
MYPLKDVLEAVSHEDVVRHTESMKDSLSSVGLSDVADLAAKAPDIINKGLSGGLFSMFKDSLNQIAEDAKREAVAKGIDYEAELLKHSHEEL